MMTTRKQNSDEIDALDLLLVVSENIKILLIIPIAAALLAFGISSVMPQTYESSFTVRTVRNVWSAQQLQELASSQRVVQLAKRNLVEQGDAELTDKLSSNSITASTSGRNPDLVIITVASNNAKEAKKLAGAAANALLNATAPRTSNNEDIEVQLIKIKEVLGAARVAEETLRKKLLESNVEKNINIRVFRDYNTMLSHIDRLENRISGLTRVDKTLSANDIIVQPNLPIAPVKPKRMPITILTFFASGFLILLFVFIRHSWINSSRNPESAAKLLRIRLALGLRGQIQK